MARNGQDVDEDLTNQYIVVSASYVHLDSLNPRHDPLEREAEIIKELCDPALVGLAEDIAEIGSLSPLEVMGVIAYGDLPGHYIAVEGNRRTCALLLLADPSRAPTPEYRDTFAKLAARAKIPRELRVFVFSNRRAAKPWIDRRHLGVQGGAGTQQWDNKAKARAAAQSLTNTSAKADVLALAVVERLSATGLLTPEQRSQASLTTLSRYLNNASRRSILGLQGLDADNKLIYTHEAPEVDSALRRLVTDSLHDGGEKKPKVHSRTSARERDSYVQSLAAHGVVPITPLPLPATPADVELTKPNMGSGRKRSTPDTSNRTKLMLPAFTLKTTDDALRRLRREMLDLPIDDHEFSANYLLRAFIERVLILYARRRQPNRQYKNDQALCDLCAEDARLESAPRKVLQVLNQNASGGAIAHSLHTLGSAVHLGVVPVRRQLIAVFDTWDAALQFMLESIRTASSKS